MSTFPESTWTCLFPPETSYQCTFDAPWLRELIAIQGENKGRVLVLNNERSGQMGGLERYDGVVGINSPGLTNRALARAGFSHVRRFAILPSLDNPRWFIPLDSPAISTSAFRLYSPTKPLARLARSAMRLAARLECPLWYRDELVIAQQRMSPIEAALAELFPGQEFRLALSAGSPPPTKNRKITIAALGKFGEPLAFVKLPGPTAAARTSVQHEAHVLQQLNRRIPTVRAPRLLKCGSIGTTCMSISAPLPGRAPSIILTAAHQRFLKSLQSDQKIKAIESGLVTSLFARFKLIDGRHDIRDALNRLSPLLGDAQLPITIVHGDFSPWNLRLHDGEIWAYDWESAEMCGLPLIDEIHHLLSVGFLVRRWSAESAAEALRRFKPTTANLSGGIVLALQMIYLIDYLLRLFGEGYGDDYRRVVWCRQVLARLDHQAKEALR